MHRRLMLKMSAISALLAACGSLAGAQEQPGGKSSDNHDETILVIGAGMAGLGAARKLHDAGYTVIVLEGRDRIGGRVWTSHVWDGIPVDLGASWIHGVRGNPISALADEIDASRATTDYDNAVYYNTDGTIVDSTVEAEIFKLFSRLLRTIEREAEQGMTLRDAIEATEIWQNLSSAQQRQVLHLFNTTIEHEFAGGINELDALNVDDADAYGGPDVLFPDGYGRVADFLARDLDIRSGQVVKRIRYNDIGVQVETSTTILSADRAIVTLPIGVLKAGLVQFVPSLPGEKQDAIAIMGAGLLDKLFLRFSTIFWEKDAEILSWISDEYGRWGEWINYAAYTGDPILLGFNAAGYARKVDSWSDTKIVDDAMRVLRTIYGSDMPVPIGWQRSRWSSDPFALCSYSFNAVGASIDTRETLGSPIMDRLFFAGEATSLDFPSTVHGAYLSGQRVAQHILDI